MAHNVTIAGVTYPDVPSITVPSNGGTASYVDTSDADATASDMKAGVTAYVGGQKVTGTGVTKYGVGIDDLFGEVDGNGQLLMPVGSKDIVLSGFTSLSLYVLTFKFTRNGSIRSLEFADLTILNSYQCLNAVALNAQNLVSVSFPKLGIVDGSACLVQAFKGCTNLESASFPLLAIIGNASTSLANRQQFQSTFEGCTNLTSISFPKLESVYCNGTAVTDGTFYKNDKVEKFYFPMLSYIGKTSNYSSSTAADNIFYGCTSLTELHFASANQSAIESSTGYSTLWGRGAGNATVYFDL